MMAERRARRAVPLLQQVVHSEVRLRRWARATDGDEV